MKILGVSASVRPWGNTDLLVQHALRGSAGEGAETRFLRLEDLQLRSCTGCMACVFKDRDCHLDDGFPKFLENLRWADALVLGSPTYVLGATGVIKTLQDRLIRFGVVREFVGRPGLAVAAAGVPGWVPLVLQQISLTLLFLGMPVVDQFVGYGQGPGEVLDDEKACRRATDGGAALARGETGFLGEAGACPACRLDQVSVTAAGRGRCALCDLDGTLETEDGVVRLVPDPGAAPRWSEASIHHHFHGRVLPSGPKFKERIPELRQRIRAFREGASS